MKIGDMFPSRYLRGCDLAGAVVVTIQRVGVETIYRPKEGETQAFILYVVGGSKGVIMSKALGEGIAQALSENDTDLWPGRKFVLYPQPMRVGGRDVVALRARAVATTQGETQGAGHE